MTQASGGAGAGRAGTKNGPIRFTVEIERPDEVLGEVGQHARAAAREILLTMRSALDVAIKIVDSSGAEHKPKASRIEIE